MDRDAAASQLAARQHNLVTRAQAHRLGITDDMIDSRLRTRRWSRMRRAVYAVGGMTPTFEQGVMAAVLTGGSTAMASHATAAMLWDLPVEPAERIEITTIATRQVRIEGVIGHRTVVLDERDQRVTRGIPTTSVARVVVDLSMRLDAKALARLFDEGLRRGLVSLRALHACVEGLGLAPGRSPDRVHALLAKRIPGYDPGESDLETEAWEWIVAAGLPAPVRQHWVRLEGRRYRLDLAYPELRIGIELDGFDTHRTRTAFDYDRDRNNDLTLAGWIILHFTSNTKREELVGAVGRAITSVRRRVV